MGVGYSLRTQKLNEEADPQSLGVRLGTACIKHGIPATQVASALGVSKQTIYNWFCGTTQPLSHLAPKIETYLFYLV